MKAFLRWLAKVVGSAVSVILIVVLFPYVSRLASKYLPDESGAAIRTSAILATELANSARLETLRVVEDGVINYDIRAAFLGTVATVNVTYKYEGSFGIDLQKVQMQVEEHTITFILPRAEVIQDVLTPNEVYKEDFWYKGFTLEDYENLLETERLARRDVYLSGENQERLWEATIDAFKATIEPWIADAAGSVEFVYTQAPAAEKD